MVSLMALVSNTSNIRYLGGFNDIIGRYGGNNDNSHSGPPNTKLDFTYILILILLSVNPPPVHMNSILEIHIYIFCLTF